MRIYQFRGDIDVARRRLVLTINYEEHDISHLLPIEILKIPRADCLNSEVSWKIRASMVETAKKYVKSISPRFPVEKINA